MVFIKHKYIFFRNCNIDVFVNDKFLNTLVVLSLLSRGANWFKVRDDQVRVDYGYKIRVDKETSSPKGNDRSPENKHF